jgi:hypothetical protein
MSTTKIQSNLSVSPGTCPLRNLKNVVLINAKLTKEMKMKSRKNSLKKYLFLLETVFANACWKG